MKNNLPPERKPSFKVYFIEDDKLCKCNALGKDQKAADAVIANKLKARGEGKVITEAEWNKKVKKKCLKNSKNGSHTFSQESLDAARKIAPAKGERLTMKK